MDTSSNSSNKHSNEEISDLINHLIISGALGRSPIYEKLLNYFFEKSTDGTSCSEYSIAVDVFDKDSDYDISADSTVRVYIYNLRKKLSNYYDDRGKNETRQLYIPKGEYRLLVRNNDDALSSVNDKTHSVEISPHAVNTSHELTNTKGRQDTEFKRWFITLGAMIATALLTVWFINSSSDQITFSDQQKSFWGDILSDNKSVMVVVGDYFIFAETQNFVDDLRLVREFDVNSAEDLERKNDSLEQSESTMTWERFDLGLTYLPRGSAYAIVRVQQLLQKANKTPRVIMRSELSAEDIRANHIIYIGYLSGLGVLEEYVFSGSRFEIGNSYDELIDSETSTVYRSDFIEAKEDRNFTDFGTITSFSLAANNQIIAITGTRDAGLMEMSDIAIATNLLDRMQLSEKNNSAYEALFEVDGFNLTNISSKLLISSYME